MSVFDHTIGNQKGEKTESEVLARVLRTEIWPHWSKQHTNHHPFANNWLDMDMDGWRGLGPHTSYDVQKDSRGFYQFSLDIEAPTSHVRCRPDEPCVWHETEYWKLNIVASELIQEGHVITRENPAYPALIFNVQEDHLPFYLDPELRLMTEESYDTLSGMWVSDTTPTIIAINCNHDLHVEGWRIHHFYAPNPQDSWLV